MIGEAGQVDYSSSPTTFNEEKQKRDTGERGEEARVKVSKAEMGEKWCGNVKNNGQERADNLMHTYIL